MRQTDDLITNGGVRIEVRASAHWQSWKLLDEFAKPRQTKATQQKDCESKIRFGSLEGAREDAVFSVGGSVYRTGS